MRGSGVRIPLAAPLHVDCRSTAQRAGRQQGYTCAGKLPSHPALQRPSRRFGTSCRNRVNDHVAPRDIDRGGEQLVGVPRSAVALEAVGSARKRRSGTRFRPPARRLANRTGPDELEEAQPFRLREDLHIESTLIRSSGLLGCHRPSRAVRQRLTKPNLSPRFAAILEVRRAQAWYRHNDISAIQAAQLRPGWYRPPYANALHADRCRRWLAR